MLWVDADALFMRFSPDIRTEIIDGKDLLLVNHEVRRPLQPGATLCLDVPNTGVMLLRNTDWTRSFLDAVWEKTDLIDHRFWENAAVHALMGYHFLVDSAERNDPDGDVMAKIGFLDRAWNSVPGTCESADPIIRHYAGQDNRLARMQDDLKVSEQAWKRGN